MKYYIVHWGADIKRNGYGFDIKIECVCGERFNFNDFASKKVPSFSNCPDCNECYMFTKEQKENYYTIIRPRRNDQVHFKKDEVR